MKYNSKMIKNFINKNEQIKKNIKFWTKEETKAIRKLIKNGITNRGVVYNSNIFNATINQIGDKIKAEKMKMQNEQFPKKNWTKEETETIKKLISEGVVSAEIVYKSNIFKNVSFEKVAQKIKYEKKKMFLPETKKHFWTKEETEFIKNFLLKGLIGGQFIKIIYDTKMFKNISYKQLRSKIYNEKIKLIKKGLLKLN